MSDKESPFSRNPKVQFGAVCVRGTRITVNFIKGRFAGGDSIRQIARSYKLSEQTIRAAINYNRGRRSTVSDKETAPWMLRAAYAICAKLPNPENELGRVQAIAKIIADALHNFKREQASPTPELCLGCGQECDIHKGTLVRVNGWYHESCAPKLFGSAASPSPDKCPTCSSEAKSIERWPCAKRYGGTANSWHSSAATAAPEEKKRLPIFRNPCVAALWG